MAFPPPNTDPRLSTPTRFADQNARLKKKEGLILPTPRTYRASALQGTSIQTTSTSPTTLGTITPFVRVGETVGIMVKVDIRRQTAVAATASIDANCTPWGTASLFPTSANLTYAANTYVTYASTRMNPVDAIVTRQIGEFFYFMQHIGNTGLTADGSVAIDIRGSRPSGSAVVEFTNLHMWAMVI